MNIFGQNSSAGNRREREIEVMSGDNQALSDFLAISFDCESSPNLKLKIDNGDTVASGWGFGWFPGDDYAASVVKDTGVRKVESITKALSDWRRFRSTNFLCKVKGAAKKPMQQDTQPFQRSFWGRDWLFLHNGKLEKEKIKDSIGESDGFLQPMGTTDSEWAFCFLLLRLQKSGGRRIADVPRSQLIEWFTELDQMGGGDFVLSDGQSTLAYHGNTSLREVYYSRIKPPCSSEIKLWDDIVELDLSDPLDTYRSSFVVSSSKLNGRDWQQMQKGQLFVIRRAKVVFDNFSKYAMYAAQIANSMGATVETASDVVGEKMNFNETEFNTNFDGALEPAVVAKGGTDSQSTVTNIKSMTHSKDGDPLEYRRFKVSHLTEYTYDKQVDQSTHILRLQPVEDKIQEVIHSTLSFSVNGEKLDYEDVFGNQSMHVTVENPYSHLAVEVVSEVKIYASPKDDFSSKMRRSSIPLVWMPWQRQMMLPYLLPPELPESQLLELTEFAMSFVERADYNLVDTLSDINRQIFEDFNYVQGSTNLHTTPFDVYVNRQGVCQDFANLFICLARLLNIPSRYRVGYIHTGANYENKVQSEASHAWVEVYLPYLGWRGFDPTNGCHVGQDHVRVACGRNFRDAAPTTGTIFKGGGGEKLNVNVKVEEL